MIISTELDHHYHLKVHQRNDALPYLVLLHGFMGSGRVFKHMLPVLKPFCNPVTIDLLGHGETSHARHHTEFNVKKQLVDLNDIFTQLPFNQYFLYGYSMGGRLALQYACNDPSHLQALFLESATFGIESSTKRKQRMITDRKRARAIEQNFSKFLDEWTKMPLFNAGKEVLPDLEQIYKKIQRDQSPHQMALSLQGFGSGVMPSCINQLPDLKLPVLLLAGSYDGKYCSIMDEMHHLLPNAELHIVPDAGHRIHLQQHKKVAEILHNFIKQ